MREASHQMYDRLLSLPLFLGLSHSDLHGVAAHTPLGFASYESGETIVVSDSPCTALLLLIHGEAESHIVSDDQEWSLDERVRAPYMHQPEHLYGWHQRHTRSLKAATPCQVLRIEKRDVDFLIRQFQTIRFNLFNALCIRAQRMGFQPWRIRPVGIVAKLVRWMEDVCDSPIGDKTFHIRMTYLAQELGESRLNLSRCLHELEDKGLLRIRRGEISASLPLSTS